MSESNFYPEGLTAQENRDFLFQQNRERLEVMASRALQRGLSPDEFIMTLIDVDDPSWTEVVDRLMPNHDWQSYRDRGEKPVARGSARTGVLTAYLGAVVPDIEVGMTMRMPEGLIKTVVMGSGGASIYFIEPSK